MIVNIFYILIIMLITYVIFYYLSGIFFDVRKHLRKIRNIRYFEHAIKKMEITYNDSDLFKKLDVRQQRELADNIRRYKETLSDIRKNGLD